MAYSAIRCLSRQPDWSVTFGPQGVPLREVFKVYPDSADIAPGGSATFKIAVRPTSAPGLLAWNLNKEQNR